MTTTITKTALTPARKYLTELMQEINFGCLKNLVLKDCEPVFDPPSKVVREIKFGGENGPRPELVSNNFTMKSQVVDLFRQFDRLGNGIVKTLEIKHGLPFLMTVEETMRM